MHWRQGLIINEGVLFNKKEDYIIDEHWKEMQKSYRSVLL